MSDLIAGTSGSFSRLVLPDSYKPKIEDLVTAGKWQEVIDFLKDNKFRDPIFDDMLIGFAYRNLGLFTDALPYAGRSAHAVIAIKQKGHIYEEGKKVLAEMGELCNCMQEYAKAKSYLTQASEFKDNCQMDTAVLARLAWSAAHLNEFNLCNEALQLAYYSAIPQNLDKVREMDSTIRVVTGDFSGSIRVLEKCQPTDQVQSNKIHIYGSLGEFSKVKEIIKTVNLQHYNKCKLPQPPADLNNLPETIYIGNDQGMGDTLCLIPWVKKLPCKVVWTVLPNQLDLLNTIKPDNVTFITEVNSELPWINSLFIPYLANIQYIYPEPPIKQVPYDINGPIGICTKGNPSQNSDFKRSLPAIDEILLVKLLKSTYPDIEIKDLTYGTDFKPKDWIETLEEVQKCRFVIAVDTGIANLCGAFGIPCKVLVRIGHDYRYAGGFPYWESTEIFIQPKYGNWKQPIQEALK